MKPSVSPLKPILLFVCIAAACLQANILLVVDSSFYAMDPKYAAAVDTYLGDIRTVDRKAANLLLWKTGSGTTRDKCYPLWRRLGREYQRYRRASGGDGLEGAIFIGSLPVPMFRHVSYAAGSGIGADTVYHDGPHDYYFMDIWDAKSDAPYAADTVLWHYSQRFGLFINPDAGSQGNGYIFDKGDGKLDIWISRVMGEFVRIPVSGHHGIWYSDMELVYEYLVRAHERMTGPARLPARSFSMSEITNWGSPDPDEIVRLDDLGLPFHTVFRHPHNNPSNLQAQLQAGPRGNINHGAYCLRTPESAKIAPNPPAHWSTRNNIRRSLFNKASGTWESDLDTLGYEWAGFYEHGGPLGMGMNGTHFAPSNKFTGLNGTFSSFSISEPVTNVSPKGNYYVNKDPGGYGGSYVKFRHQDVCNSTVPGYPSIWEYGWNWTGQSGEWKLRPPVPGQYDMYIYYRAFPENNSRVTLRIDRMPLHDSGAVLTAGTVLLNQRVHTTEEFPGNNWERIGRFALESHFTAGWITYRSDTTRVTIDANGNDEGGYFILDAVKIVGVAGTPAAGRTVIVDDASEGFSMSPRGDRTYLELQADGGPSKTPFFLSNSCHLCDYPATTGCAYNNLGNLFAMLYGGLISMGTVNNNFSGNGYDAFITALKSGSDFGRAFLAKANETIDGSPEYILLGAGNLKAAAYIPFGARLLADVTVNEAIDAEYTAPAFLRNYTVTPAGSLRLRAAKEIRILPEAAFRKGCGVRLSAR